MVRSLQIIRTRSLLNRFPAFDGQLENLAALSAYDSGKAEKFYGRPLSSAELGCYKSHLGCVERFLKTDEELCLVLEDDVHIPKGHAATFSDFCKTLNQPQLGNDVLRSHCFFSDLKHGPLECGSQSLLGNGAARLADGRQPEL